MAIYDIYFLSLKYTETYLLTYLPYLTPYCFRQLVDWYNLRSHAKIWRKIQKFIKISEFQNIVILRFSLTLMYKNCFSLLDFEATGLIFYMQV